jgi:hypothetical protein
MATRPSLKIRGFPTLPLGKCSFSVPIISLPDIGSQKRVLQPSGLSLTGFTKTVRIEIGRFSADTNKFFRTAPDKKNPLPFSGAGFLDTIGLY